MKVYAKTDFKNRITAVNSAAFLPDVSDWTEIDEGEGDKYNLAQAHYFPLPLTDDNGVYRYKLVDGAAVDRTEEEISIDTQAIHDVQQDVDSTDDIMLDMLADHEFRLCIIELGV